MSESISLYWPISNNFGDLIGKYILEKMTGRTVIYAEPHADYEHYVFGGSVINHCGPKSVVWGAGLGTITDGINSHMKVAAVRGPHTRGRALSVGIDCPAVYGDPGMVLPRFHEASTAKSRKIGVVPHYVDQFRAFHRYSGSAFVVDVFASVESVIEQIHSCERIFSSSLHGIILAHAYGVPATWVKISDSVGGDGTKFRDYFASVGMDVPYPIDLRDRDRLPELSDDLPGMPVSEFWKACPVPMEFRKPEYR